MSYPLDRSSFSSFPPRYSGTSGYGVIAQPLGSETNNRLLTVEVYRDGLNLFFPDCMTGDTFRSIIEQYGLSIDFPKRQEEHCYRYGVRNDSWERIVNLLKFIGENNLFRDSRSKNEFLNLISTLDALAKKHIPRNVDYRLTPIGVPFPDRTGTLIKRIDANHTYENVHVHPFSPTSSRQELTKTLHVISAIAFGQMSMVEVVRANRVNHCKSPRMAATKRCINKYSSAAF